MRIKHFTHSKLKTTIIINYSISFCEQNFASAAPLSPVVPSPSHPVTEEGRKGGTLFLLDVPSGKKREREGERCRGNKGEG